MGRDYVELRGGVLARAVKAWDERDGAAEYERGGENAAGDSRVGKVSGRAPDAAGGHRCKARVCDRHVALWRIPGEQHYQVLPSVLIGGNVGAVGVCESGDGGKTTAGVRADTEGV